jgi:wyosine [tRNA(Phe)-imidazoG37] synthetase (radical SAM superfamily)
MKYIYGPVKSRRLGNSLGISLVPYKVCSFDCVYCQLGETTIKTLERKEYVNLEEVIQELRSFILSEDFKREPINYITLSGAGEPTLFARAGEFILNIKKLVNIPVAVLTNGSLLADMQLRKELFNADLIIATLNAATKEVFEKICRPFETLDLEAIIGGLIAFRKEFRGRIYLEIMLVKGVNDSLKEMDKLKEIVDKINPNKIQLVMPTRLPVEDWVVAPDLKTVKKIQEIFGDKAEVF